MKRIYRLKVSSNFDNWRLFAEYITCIIIKIIIIIILPVLELISDSFPTSVIIFLQGHVSTHSLPQLRGWSFLNPMQQPLVRAKLKERWTKENVIGDCPGNNILQPVQRVDIYVLGVYRFTSSIFSLFIDISWKYG